MTKLRPDTPLIRETDVWDHTDPLVIELWPRYMRIRLKGERAAVDVGYRALFELGKTKLAYRRQKGA